MNLAVIRTSGKQYLVKEGDTISVDAPPKEIDVLLVTDGENIKVGTPLVDGVVVKFEVVKSGLGPKIRVAKFKAKSRYRKVIGFRPKVTTVKINAISVRPGKRSRTS